MTTTQRSRDLGLKSAPESVNGHDLEDEEVLAPPARIAHGTPWPAAAVRPAPDPFLDESEEIDEDLDVDLTEPVSLAELEPERLPGSSLFLEIDDIGTRTLMGVGARAVRAVAKSGWVEARAARGPQATPEVPSPYVTLPGVDSSPAPEQVERVIVSLAEAPPVRPQPLRPAEPPVAPATEVPPAWAVTASPAQLAEAMRMIAPITPAAPIVPIAEPGPDGARQPSGPALANAERASRSASRYRALGVGAIALAVAALAAYLATAAFYAFSTSWAMPVVISPSDEKVVSLRSGLAAQQHQRDRLAAELEAVARTIAGDPDPRSDAAHKVRAQQEVLQASIARQDEIIRGLEQAPYLRALADRASVALVPYDNLAGIAQGTKLFACRVAMVMCREVGRVRAILPGEVTFKHPHRDKAMRGQMIELELSAPAAAAEDVLFLGGAPLLF